MDRRLLTAVAGLAVSLVVSAVAWFAFGVPFLFFFVPFVPFLFRRDRPERTVRTCPVCDFRTTDEEYEYCPRDGHRLESEPDG